MRHILSLVLFLSFFDLNAQDFKHAFTVLDDSVQLQGLRVYLEIDSVYEVSDSSGVKFALEIVNEGTEALEIINPLYDTELRINPTFWKLPTKQKLKLKEVSRWPNPHYAKKIKPYKLEKVILNDELVQEDQYAYYWERDTLMIEAHQKLRYELNFFEYVLADEKNEPYIEPLSKGEYYVIFNIRIRIKGKRIVTDPLRFKVRLQ